MRVVHHHQPASTYGSKNDNYLILIGGSSDVSWSSSSKYRLRTGYVDYIQNFGLHFDTFLVSSALSNLTAEFGVCFDGIRIPSAKFLLAFAAFCPFCCQFRIFFQINGYFTRMVFFVWIFDPNNCDLLVIILLLDVPKCRPFRVVIFDDIRYCSLSLLQYAILCRLTIESHLNIH